MAIQETTSFGGLVSTNNSTTDTLSGGAVFTGTGDNVRLNYYLLDQNASGA